MKVEISVPAGLMNCYKAGVETRDLDQAILDTHIWMEYRGASSVRTGLQSIARHASSLSSTMTGKGRKAAQDLSKYAKKVRESVKGNGVIAKKKMRPLELKIFEMKSMAHFLSVSGKAQCGDEVSKGSLVKFRPPKLGKGQ